MIYLALIPLRGGGKRLIKNIINKYRLGNEYKEIKENVENKGSSEDNYEYYIVNLETIPENIAILLFYSCIRASGYDYGAGGWCSYTNCPLAILLGDTNIKSGYIIVRYDNKSTYGKIEKYGQTLETTIIEDNLNIYDNIVLILTSLGDNIDRETIKQTLPLIQSSKEEYYNIVDLDLPKNYDKILEERGYIE